ncbi:peptidoglycan-associated lipoprotein [Limnohabitans sp. Jir61]|jgi:peptidoglycan-associated lipoprotein|uniref:peptidoglycan-associated lipoprotein Pal n=1 Tax=Limnohabitans sp. Jir61 TaxID=1826168 RepID=UPI000D3A600B|nr:peptidoglycan-associated lipoprotein Pal [Limnohabitans sp. Jir61]PUE33063.1 peptidoglycan-associated lipoprotein [Limnohabitans sp. Jir61]
MKKLLLLLSIAAVLSGCASGVKLSDVQVDDRSGSATGQMGGTNGLNARNLAAMQGIKQGPVGVDHIIYFELDSYTVKAEYQSALEAHARFLRADRNRRVNLEGHTDERGGSEYNLALGQKRSDAVRRALSALGVPEGQMESVSFGKEKPVAQGSDESAYSQNRRAALNYQ